jgi:hypothetical protein
MSLYLRTTDKYGRSFGGFQWPPEVGATVTAPDWKPTARCGNGLHGLLDGLGNYDHLSTNPDAIWWIVSAENAIDLWGKYKFQSCTVVQFGDRPTITAALYKLRPGPIPFLVQTGGERSVNNGGHFAINIGGHSSTNTGGERSSNTGGHRSVNAGGHYSINTGGDGSTNTGGYLSANTGGKGSNNSGGDQSVNTGGHSSVNTGGHRSVNTGGDRSKNNGGEGSKNIGGNNSVNIGDHGSTNTGGYNSINRGGIRSVNTGGSLSINSGGEYSTLVFLRWINGHKRVLTAYVGENDIKPGVSYRASDDHTAVVEA